MLAFLASPALAQELPVGEQGPVVAPVATAGPRNLSFGFRWGAAGPDGVDQLSDVALHALRSQTWAAAALDGGVWLTEDAGRSWTLVLPSLSLTSADEEILLAVQARIQELVSQVEAPSESTFEDNGYVDVDALQAALEDAQEQARALAAQATAEVQSEVEAGPWFLEQQAVMGGDRDRARPRVWFASDGRLLAARADGLRVSRDLGATWDLVLDAPVTALAELEEGRFLAGLTDGLAVTTDLREWSRIPEFEGVRATDVVVDLGVWVTSPEGAWGSPDLAAWRPVDSWTAGAYTARRPTPGGGLLVAGDDTLHLTWDPFGAAPVAVQGGPVPKATALLRREDGGLLAASSTGPWHSVDAGRTWISLAFGSREFEVRDVESRGDLVLLAGAGGLLRLEPAGEDREAPEVRLPDWVPLGVLVDAATQRRELTARSGRRWVAAMLPELSLEGTWNQDIGDDWDADTWTLRSVDTWWQVKGQLTWRPGRQRSSTSFDSTDDLAGNVSVLLVDGDVIVDDGTSNAIVGNAVRRGATQYSSELASTVGDLWTTRQRLVGEEARAGGELLDRVYRRLRILETEARLDALTEGAVSAWDPSTGGRG